MNYEREISEMFGILFEAADSGPSVLLPEDWQAVKGVRRHGLEVCRSNAGFVPAFPVIRRIQRATEHVAQHTVDVRPHTIGRPAISIEKPCQRRLELPPETLAFVEVSEGGDPQVLNRDGKVWVDLFEERTHATSLLVSVASRA